MTAGFLITTLFFVVLSVVMILVILVQRPQGGGLAGAFGGAGGGGTETVFGGRVGDALTWATVVIFVVYLGTAITLNLIESAHTTQPAESAASPQFEPSPTITTEEGQPMELTPMEGPPPDLGDVPPDLLREELPSNDRE